ncbi:hypothetical protein DM01DRAFT_1409167 [Hesseltinella vesiculosa]|uniref:Zn(2)-C6 fungal-type domain-containing protein n=1 Tax=Hesseltinella vesiculosa TaxID=101127 RepID=A0A1X2GBY0_9FUNG|nr:hypothetical protein DM01DRAFT_1409167 [Hesseltinella vesiculosa]
MSGSCALVISNKKKISCLQCRARKVKCDGQMPCHRCTKRDESCVFQPHAKAGRPANNAVMNRLVKFKQDKKQSVLFNDFIFETLSYTIHTDTKFISPNHSLTLGRMLDPYFQEMAMPLQQWAERRMQQAIPFIPDIVMYDLTDLHTWSAMEIVNVMVQRISRLGLKHFEYYDPIAAAVFLDLVFKFFGEKIRHPLSFNPLATLDDDAALRLIDTFFQVHPHSFLLNKTLVLQGYWLKTIEPMLLSAIFGTAVYFSRMLDNKPVRLWEAIDHDNRNPFLEYAHDLLQDSTTAATFSKYQATVILGLFDATFGSPKRGTGALILAGILSKSLGILDGALDAELTAVESELIRMSFWCIFSSTVRGSMDHGHMPSYRMSKSRMIRQAMGIALPPSTPSRSVSYQFELSNGCIRDQKNYDTLVETFYCNTVVCSYTMKLLAELPEVSRNIYNTEPSDVTRVPGLPHLDNLKERFVLVLDELACFIAQHKSTWSRMQRFTMQTFHRLYSLHVHVMRPTRAISSSDPSFSNSMFDVFVTNDDEGLVLDLEQMLPIVFDTLDDTLGFAAASAEEQLYIPQGALISTLDTCLEILMRAPVNATQQHYIGVLDTLCTKTDHLWKEWSGIESIQQRLKGYIESQQPPLVEPPTSLTDFSLNDRMAMTAFFDPMATTWIAELDCLQAPVDMRLVSQSPIASTSSYITAETPTDYDLIPQDTSCDSIVSLPFDLDSLTISMPVDSHPTFSSL